MPIIECSNGHFYDNIKFDRCPVCGESQKNVDVKRKFVIVSDNENSVENLMTERYDEEKSDNSEEKTISINLKNNRNILTTGWLVCINGECRGNSFPIKTDRNFIGRDYDMDIVIPDKNISRIKHCSIVYDSINCEFYLVNGNSPVLLNDNLVMTNVKLNENDVLCFGNSKYVFIPYCKKGRTWND